MFTRAGLRILSLTIRNANSFRTEGPEESFTRTGISRGALPSSPNAPADRSWEIRPTIGPVAPSLNELWTLGTTVRMLTRVMGKSTAPRL